MGIMKKIGNATIVKQCTTLAGWLTKHPYLTFIGYNAIFVAMCCYAWKEGCDEGERIGYRKGFNDIWDKAYKSGYDEGEAFGRIEQRNIDREIYVK